MEIKNKPKKYPIKDKDKLTLLEIKHNDLIKKYNELVRVHSKIPKFIRNIFK
jgi:hypothetical protein